MSRFCIAFTAIFYLLAFVPLNAKTFEIGEKDFLLDGQPIVLRSGELHYSRIPREYWQHRLQMCKAMGLNTVCAYMFWNYHEPKPGEFYFSGMADVADFCRLAQQQDLLVILRPGPYSCAEWDFGGFPYWLLKDENMQLRSRYHGYLQACKRYVMRVGQELAPLQISNGGPIIMVQVENEYGSYGSDREYIGTLRDYWKEAGFNVPFFTCDGPVQLQNDVREDIFSVVNFSRNPASAFKALRDIRPTGPLMCGEFYPAWFDHWGKKHHTKKAKEILPDLKYMLQNDASFSLYMVHGGTSFGFTAGANYADRYQPQTTSYDYDAPISEAGWETEKYLKLRELFSGYMLPGEHLPDIPERNPVITIPQIFFRQSALLYNHPASVVKSEFPLPLEKYDQSQGCAVYKTIIPAHEKGILNFSNLCDFAHIYINEQKIATFDRRKNKGKWETGFNSKGQNVVKKTDLDKYCLSIPLDKQRNDVELKVFVEAMGHINYGAVMGTDRKGIVGPVVFTTPKETTELTDWDVSLFPLDEKGLASLKFDKQEAHGPAFYRSTFNLTKTGDTFLDMSRWGKGVVWVNGHNLGRYWKIGPAQTLYLPEPWLKTGENEIIILELLESGQKSIKGRAEPILDRIRD